MFQIDIVRAQNQRKPWLQRTLFISGRLSLDFAQSGGPGPYKKFERLHTPADLALWFSLSALGIETVSVTQADLRQAHKLRWAIWRTANALRDGEAADEQDIQLINHAAAAPPLSPVFDPNNAKQTWQKPANAKAALSTIARDAIEVFSHETIQQCAGSYCPLLFVDSSRSGKRKWCAMERCGNLAKVTKYRKDRE